MRDEASARRPFDSSIRSKSSPSVVAAWTSDSSTTSSSGSSSTPDNLLRTRARSASRRSFMSMENPLASPSARLTRHPGVSAHADLPFQTHAFMEANETDENECDDGEHCSHDYRAVGRWLAFLNRRCRFGLIHLNFQPRTFSKSKF